MHVCELIDELFYSNNQDNSKHKKYKNMYDVTVDIAVIWNNLNETERYELAQEIVGNRYFDIFNEIIDHVYE